jgi:hypothetical protein
MPTRFLSLGVAVVAICATADVTFAQQFSFSNQLFPILQKAGCPNCHNSNGVASATRLHFPDEDAPADRIDAFGKSLVELIDRKNLDNSLLLLKPTNRVPHGGGLRIARNSPEETTLRAWIAYLATLSGSELTFALSYRRDEAAGHGVAQTAVLRRMTHSQYDNTVHDLLHEASSPASQFPPEDFVNGFKDQYEALSISPIQGEAYSIAAARLAANAFRRGDSRGLVPCKTEQSGCGARFVRSFGPRAFRRPLTENEAGRYTALFETQKDAIAGAQLVIEAMLQSPNFLFWLDDTPNPNWKP